jgi:hypothetical protein
MDVNEYKRLTGKKEVFDFHTLKKTQQYLEENDHKDIAQRVADVLAQNKIETPFLHNKSSDPQAGFYKVDLPYEDLQVIVDMFADLEAGALDDEYRTTPAASFFASMVDRWNRLLID